MSTTTEPESQSESEVEAPIELEIERLAPSGEGVGREASGRVVFVPFTAPGDRVRVRLTESRARFARGVIDRIETPGPSRADPMCSVFGSCGGCTWQHVRYETQVEAKAAIISDALRRIGHLDVPGPIEVLPSPVEYGYRIRTRVRVEGDAVGYRQRRSHDLCPTKQCPILAPALERTLPELPGRANGRSGDWWLAMSADGTVHATAAGTPPPSKRRGRTRTAPARVSLSVGGASLECGVGGFHQANGPLFETVAAAVISAAGSGDAVLELFAGAGYLTLGLSKKFHRVWAVEGSQKAAADLRRNVERASAEGVEVLAGSVERILGAAHISEAAPSADVVVIDPPRAGLTPGSIDRLVEFGIPRLVYLSCDPATLARDGAILSAGGYALESVRGFDLFPQTPHVEVLAVFARLA